MFFGTYSFSYSMWPEEPSEENRALQCTWHCNARFSSFTVVMLASATLHYTRMLPVRENLYPTLGISTILTTATRSRPLMVIPALRRKWAGLTAKESTWAGGRVARGRVRGYFVHNAAAQSWECLRVWTSHTIEHLWESCGDYIGIP
jgi:hypothetical protein